VSKFHERLSKFRGDFFLVKLVEVVRVCVSLFLRVIDITKVKEDVLELFFAPVNLLLSIKMFVSEQIIASVLTLV